MKPGAADSVKLLDRDIAEKNLEGHWRLGLESYFPDPRTAVQPYLRKWEDVY